MKKVGKQLENSWEKVGDQLGAFGGGILDLYLEDWEKVGSVPPTFQNGQLPSPSVPSCIAVLKEAESACETAAMLIDQGFLC